MDEEPREYCASLADEPALLNTAIQISQQCEVKSLGSGGEASSSSVTNNADNPLAVEERVAMVPTAVSSKQLASETTPFSVASSSTSSSSSVVDPCPSSKSSRGAKTKAVKKSKQKKGGGGAGGGSGGGGDTKAPTAGGGTTGT